MGQENSLAAFQIDGNEEKSMPFSQESNVHDKVQAETERRSLT